MARKGISAEKVKEFKKAKPKAKNKRKQATSLENAQTAHSMKARRPSQEYVDPKAISAGQLRGVMNETMARVYQEMWPNMSVHDENGEVDIEIAEEGYILSLTMVCGNPNYLPRKGLKMREVEISGTARFCKDHR